MSARFRHRFEPAQLVLGLLLLFAGVGCVLQALGDWQVSVRLLLLVVPVALGLSACISLTTFLARGRARERGAGERGAESAGEQDT